MKLDITSRHFTPSVHLKDMICERVQKIEKFVSNIINCHIILIKEYNTEEVEIILNIKNYKFISKVVSGNFEKSLIGAIEKIIVQVKKQHSKLTKH